MALSRREKKLFICEDNDTHKCEGFTKREYCTIHEYANYKVRCLFMDEAGFCDKPDEEVMP